jgi:beta-glucosidase
MSEKKNFFKVRRTRVWFITTASIAALAITVNVLATSNLLSGVLNAVFGGPRAILADTSSVLYEKKTTSKADAKANSESVTKELTSEGIVLLKNSNNALPLKAGAKVSVFGKNSVSMIYGSSGSGGGDSTEAVTLYQSLTDAGFSYNAKLKSFYDDSNASGSGRTPNPSIENSGNVVLETGETPIASYTNDVQSSYGEYSDAAIVVFTRIAGEGFDLPMTMGYNKDRHYLQLDDNETALLKHVCEQSFSHVIVLINSNNPMELGFLDDSTNYAFQEKIDAALWCGGFGNVGITSFGKVLSGAINPSGHLPDTYVRDFKQDPVWQNFGNNRIFGGKTTGDQYNEDGDPINYYFVDYEEGIYVGYRYWETRGKSEGEDWYKSHVVYPFGYGLSYSSFTWEVENKEELQSKQITKDGTIEVKVKVTNDSEVAGKDVVEIYAGLPYTAGGIEKPYEALAGFAKTSLLKPHASESVTVEIDPYYLASFDENDANRNDFKGYELEAGDYQLFVNSDAHTVKDTITLPKLETGIEWANDPVTGTAVTPAVHGFRSSPSVDAFTQRLERHLPCFTDG